MWRCVTHGGGVLASLLVLLAALHHLCRLAESFVVRPTWRLVTESAAVCVGRCGSAGREAHSLSVARTHALRVACCDRPAGSLIPHTRALQLCACGRLQRTEAGREAHPLSVAHTPTQATVCSTHTAHHATHPLTLVSLTAAGACAPSALTTTQPHTSLRSSTPHHHHTSNKQ